MTAQPSPSEPSVEPPWTAPDVVSVERVIAAPAAEIFAIIADPSRHHEIDGSGTVRDAKGAPATLTLGSTFGMSMKWGLPYSMHNTVVEFEQDRRIAWQTTGAMPLIGRFIGGRIWRYELEPASNGTLVRESWDISHERFKAAVRGMAKRTSESMRATLDRLAAAVSGAAPR